MRTFITNALVATATLCSVHAVLAQDAPMGPTQNGPPPAAAVEAPAPAPTAEPAAVPQPQMGPSAPVAKATDCPGNPNPLGVSRVVEIDTTGGPGFGFQHYKTYDFLNPKEVVLTFDDGPLPGRTTAVLAALDAECTQATFFTVGKAAGG